jgi:hypothetical protein
MFPLPPLNLSAGGGPSGASANNGISTPFEFGFNFDNSGWVVNEHSSGTTTTSGNKDANHQSQVPQNLAGGVLGQGMLPILLIGAALAYYLMNR